MSSNNLKDKKVYYLLNQMMSIIIQSTNDIPNVVFKEYLNHKEHKSQKQIYNLFADTFLSLSAFCKLIFDHSWSQAAIILRTAIEQVSKLYILAYFPNSRKSFIDLYIEYGKFLLLNENEKENYLKTNSIKKNRFNEYFSYSWISGFTKDKKYGRDQLLKLANLDEFKVDIKETLNLFVHGRISIFEFYNSKEKWGLMDRYGRRIILMACKLFDFLCCSFCNYIGDSFFKLPFYQILLNFKGIYLCVIKNKID